jgi:flagellar basal-body rod modification protein FlgD
MQSLQTAFSQNALSNAANIIGKNIEDGNIGENGVSKAYTVRSVENVDGEIQVIAQQMLYLEDRIITDEEEPSIINYNVNGEIMDENGNLTGDKIALNNPGEPLLDEDGKLVVLDENNEQIEHNYKLAGVSSPVYSDELTSIPFSTITKVF